VSTEQIDEVILTGEEPLRNQHLQSLQKNQHQEDEFDYSQEVDRQAQTQHQLNDSILLISTKKSKLFLSSFSFRA
jgi:hypothetical protein